MSTDSEAPTIILTPDSASDQLAEAAEQLTNKIADVIDPDDRLFAGDRYDDPRLKLESKDGHRIDEIVIAFNGSITLDRRDPDDVELWKRLQMGREVSFQVDGKIVGDALLLKPATEKRRELLSGKRTVGIHSLEEVE